MRLKLAIFPCLILLTFNSCKKDEIAYSETLLGKWHIEGDKQQQVEFLDDGIALGNIENDIFRLPESNYTVEGNKLQVGATSYKIEYMKNNSIEIKDHYYGYSSGDYTRYTSTYKLTRLK